MCLGHLRNHDLEHFLARGNQLVQSDRRCSRAPEILIEICTDIASVWRKHLDLRSIVAHDVGEECLPQGLGYALVGQKIPDVDKVAGVLTIKRRDKFAGIEIVEGDDLGFGLSECVFDDRRDLHRSGFKHAAAHHRRHFDFDLSFPRPDDKAVDDAFLVQPAWKDLSVRQRGRNGS